MTEQSRPRHLIVVGAGISGLSAANRLCEMKRDKDRDSFRITVLDAASRAGGVINTLSRDGVTMELGPDSFLTQKPWAVDLVKRLGLEERLIETNRQNRRTFVARKGRLSPLPEGFVLMAPSSLWHLASSPLFSWPGKVRMAMDLLIPPRKGNSDESVADFVKRRLGREALERVAQPMIGGIYTGCPEKLSAAATIPRFRAMEQEHGSLIRGLMKSRDWNASGARYGLFASLDNGLKVLVDRLVSCLPAGALRTGVSAQTILSQADGRFKLLLGSGEELHADGLILATPAYQTARLVKDLDCLLSEKLATIDFASSAVLNLVFAREDIDHRLDGFGFVVPASEGLSLIACSFHSIKFPGRAPNNLMVLRVFAGGELNPDVVDMDDSDLERRVLDDIACLLGVHGRPVMSVVSRYPQAMPQYRVGHLNLVEDIRRLADCIPGLTLAGNYFCGLGIPDCIKSGEDAASGLFEQINAG